MDTKKLEQEAYDALKRFYSATTAQRDDVNVVTDDISFYVSAFASRPNYEVQISGHMLTPMMHKLREQHVEEIKLTELIVAGWPTVAVGICSTHAVDFYAAVMEHVATIRKNISGVGHA